MTHRQPSRTIRRTRIRWGRVAALLLVGATIAVALGDRLPATPPTSATASAPESDSFIVSDEPSRPLGIDDGAIPDGTTLFDDAIAGVANLDPALLDALRRADGDAANAGVELLVDSGWRSRDYQQHLLDEAVAKYGSADEAARWVATPDTSAHVSGDAVDIGPAAAAEWLDEHGAAYGLCRIYGNEPWHFELRPDASAAGCPATYPDPTHDPRLQR